MNSRPASKEDYLRDALNRLQYLRRSTQRMKRATEENLCNKNLPECSNGIDNLTRGKMSYEVAVCRAQLDQLEHLFNLPRWKHAL